jgi:hypothetical protein
MSLPGTLSSLHDIMRKCSLQMRHLEQSLARDILLSEKLGELCAMHKRQSVHKVCTVFVRPGRNVAYDTLPFDHSPVLPEKVVYSNLCHLDDSSDTVVTWRHVRFHKSLYRDGVYVGESLRLV